METYIIQLLTIFFTVYFAKMQGPIIDHIEHAGAAPNVWQALHKYGAFVKWTWVTLIGGAIQGYSNPTVAELIFECGVNGLWIYLLFDIILNLIRKTIPRKWYYLGYNDTDGKRWLGWFGIYAGRVKAYICGGLIIIFNILNELFL